MLFQMHHNMYSPLIHIETQVYISVYLTRRLDMTRARIREKMFAL